MNKFQEWANRRKPKVTRPVKTEEVEVCQPTPEEELKEAWEEWKIAFKWPIRIFKVCFWFSITVVGLWACAVVDIQNDCYLDKECRAAIQRANGR